MTAPRMTFKQAAVHVLQDRGPMHYQALTDHVLQNKLFQTTGSTPAASLNAIIAVDIKNNGPHSTFIRIQPGVFGLRNLHETTQPEDTPAEDSPPEDTESRVHIPLFPLYSELRHLLRIWPGHSRKQITGLQATVNELRGTPQNPVNWTDPDTWISERLQNDDLTLALAIWKSSNKTVNPRYTYGHWLLAQRYKLLHENTAGLLELTTTGRAFLENPGGEQEAALDEAEGLIKLLSIIADNSASPVRNFTDEWADYLQRRSRFGTESTIQSTLRLRLNNLLDRQLIERRSNLYSITETGLNYLNHTGDEDSVSNNDHTQLWPLIRHQENTVRESLHELLLEMDPIAFEHLIKRLLIAMNYQNVEVTTRSNDGGVDVIAEIELGITSIREVVQAKRHRRTIQRKDLDALRGSLYRFHALRGTIVTTANFARGTIEAALAPGAAPITLIDGHKLIDLLIEHSIGVRKRTVELLEVDPTAFADEEVGE